MLKEVALSIGLAVGLLMAQGAAAQVFKCKGGNGETVYSQHPCGPQAQEMKVRAAKAPSVSAAEVANRDAVYRSTDLSDAAIAERNCLASSRASIYPSAESRIAGYQRQIAGLNASAERANNNLAGATLDAGIRAQISGLQQSITSEHQVADTAMNAARQRCADQRREREAVIGQKYNSQTP